MFVNKLDLTLISSLFFLSLSACSDDSDESTDSAATDTMMGTDTAQSTNSGGTQTDSTSTDSTGEASARYALISQIFAPDNNRSYIIVSDRLDDPNLVSVAGGIEFPGRAIAAGLPELGALFVGGSEGPTLTRFNLDANGQLVRGTELSFAPYGVASIGEYQGQIQIVSPTLAYFLDGKTAQAIVWNPTDMTLVSSIDLSALNRTDAILTFAPHPVRIEHKVYVAAGWRSSDNLRIPSETAMIALDTTTQSVQIATDTRCGYARDAAIGANQQLYVIADAYAAAVHRLADTAAPAPCVLRYDPLSATFDSGYYVNATDLTGGQAAGSAIPGAPGKMLFKVLDASLASIQPDTHPRALASAPAWRWWELTLDDSKTAQALTQLAPGAGSQLPMQLGDRLMYPEFSADYGSTRLFEVVNGVPTGPTLTTEGLVFSAVKIR